MQRAKTVEGYLSSHPQWKLALNKLRKALQSTELVETVKWGAPCYTIDGKNVVGLAAFSDVCGALVPPGRLPR
ncbi:MAG: hypothetical protein ACI8QZ_000706 [Chlamydiales bacterium]|jgi:uncharacterized protein YdeI (YjbR/CyaY-like superfamily)